MTQFRPAALVAAFAATLASFSLAIAVSPFSTMVV
jgi:hypothetical protein